MNSYEYAEGDPVNILDHDGRDTKSCENKCDLVTAGGWMVCIGTCSKGLKHPVAMGVCVTACMGFFAGDNYLCKRRCKDEDKDKRNECSWP